MAQGISTTRTAFVPLALCLSLTAAAAALIGRAERQAEQAELARAVTSASDRIRERMASYVSVLRGSAGLLARPEPLTAEEFRDFIARLKLPEHYPGTLGIGYTVDFGATTPAEATALAHADGWTNVHVWPATPRDEVHAIVLLEPLDERNQAALGFDMRTEPTRREAMDRARDEGDVVLSGRVTLVQEIEAYKQPGFLLYSPIYEGGAVPATLAERRAKLQGYVYAPLRAGDLLEGIFGGEQLRVAFELYDGDDLADEDRLYSFGRRVEPDDEVTVENLPIAGRVWTARFVCAVVASGPPPLTVVVVGLGALLSVVVFLVTCARERARGREVSATASALASKEMLRLNDMFIGILGHDLRTPLNAIMLSAERLLKKVGDQGDMVAPLQRIQGSARRMMRMIDQMLDITRARLGGGIAVAPRPVELGSLVRDVVDEVLRASPEGRVELVTTGELAGAWDPDRLAQVFSNLIGNAVRYRLDEPVVVRLDGTATDRVVATVHNAGLIDPSLLPVVFEAFRGGGGRQGKRATGLGLGLYITRAIVHAHRGTVEVSSAAPAGTTFTVSLPRASGLVTASAVRSSGWRRRSPIAAPDGGAPVPAGGRGDPRAMSPN